MEPGWFMATSIDTWAADAVTEKQKTNNLSEYDEERL